MVDPNAHFEGAVVVNEIMYQPYSANVNEEWIELYNTTGQAINLSGWRFTKGITFEFPEVVIAPHGFLWFARTWRHLAPGTPRPPTRWAIGRAG